MLAVEAKMAMQVFEENTRLRLDALPGGCILKLISTQME
jgi:hypothetical protein